MSKYIRHQAVIARQSDSDIDEDHWLKQFRKSLEKSAVQPRSTDSSLFDQINSVMNGKSKHQSVESAVEDMKERSGLTAYLNMNKQSTIEESTVKTASDEAEQNNINEDDAESDIDKYTPNVLKKRPDIKNTIENCIMDTNGNMSVPAIIEKVRSIHQSDITDSKDWDDDKLTILVSKINLDAKKNNPDNSETYSNLGMRDHDVDIDASNTDAFHSLIPAQ
jgi:hypothetical protein